MLSFLRDQSFDELPAEQNAAGGEAPSAGGEAGSDQDYIKVSTNPSRVRKSTAVLAILLVAGLVCIWYMMRRTTPQSAGAATSDANETDIAAAITRITGVRSEIFGKMDELVDKFNEFSDVPQVGTNELVKNPFELEMLLAKMNAESDTPVVKADSEAMRRQRMNKQAAELSLLTIMQSDERSCCMINNKFLYEGDSIGNFTIAKIERGFVKLLWSTAEGGDSPGGDKQLETILKLAE